jgi:hypothetical protein
MDIKEAVSRIKQELQLVEHGGKYGRDKGIFTAGNHWVFADNIVRTFIGLEANLANIDWSKPQTTETMIGSELYKSWDVEVRKAIGRCMSLFIAKDWLPIQLKCANPGQSGKRIYVTTDTVLPPTIKRIRIISLSKEQALQLANHKQASSISARYIRIGPALLSPAAISIAAS